MRNYIHVYWYENKDAPGLTSGKMPGINEETDLATLIRELEGFGKILILDKHSVSHNLSGFLEAMRTEMGEVATRTLKRHLTSYSFAWGEMALQPGFDEITREMKRDFDAAMMLEHSIMLKVARAVRERNADAMIKIVMKAE